MRDLGGTPNPTSSLRWMVSLSVDRIDSTRVEEAYVREDISAASKGPNRDLRVPGNSLLHYGRCDLLWRRPAELDFDSLVPLGKVLHDFLGQDFGVSALCLCLYNRLWTSETQISILLNQSGCEYLDCRKKMNSQSAERSISEIGWALHSLN